VPNPITLIGWPTTAAAVAAALVAEFVVTRLAKDPTRRRGTLWLGLWLLAIVLFLVSQLALFFLQEEVLALVVQQEAQHALFWAIVAALLFFVAVLVWKGRSKKADKPSPAWQRMVAVVISTAVALYFGFLAAGAARVFWLDAFTAPLRLEGRIERKWWEHATIFDTIRVYSVRVGPRHFAYVSVGGRKVQLTWDVYGELQVGQEVALDIGAGSGRAIGLSTATQ
jgi:hypothetical protein